jgi:23S rRNA (uracil1939-C5)-methyltransferase
MTLARLTIDSIAAGGDGVARADGLVVFVPRSAPGDVADVSFTSRGRFARGELRALAVPSPLRTEPPCAHYVRDRCGGCQLQHLQYDAQLEAKGRIVGDALARIGKRQVSAPAVRPSASPWRYRRKLTLALRRGAAKARGEGEDGDWLAGLHPYDAPQRVFALRECPITNPRVLAVWRDVLAAASDLPRAAELRGAVRLDAERELAEHVGEREEGGASFVLEGGAHWPRAREFFARVPSLDALWWIPEGKGRVLLAERRQGLAPGASFAQVNAEVAEALRQHVLARVLAYEPAMVVDAYAGLGDTAAALALPGRRVTAIELDPEAAAWCGARLPAGSRAIAGRVEDALPTALPADVVVLNPPRAGVDERVTATLQHAAPAPRAILYVSCNPATLARDLARLPAWRVASVLAFDMFPQTAHVETVCELVPEGGAEAA